MNYLSTGYLTICSATPANDTKLDAVVPKEKRQNEDERYVHQHVQQQFLLSPRQYLVRNQPQLQQQQQHQQSQQQHQQLQQQHQQSQQQPQFIEQPHQDVSTAI
jgi:hypothetical protein